MPDSGVRVRTAVAGILGLLALMLTFNSFQENPASTTETVSRSLLESIDSVVDSLLHEKGVDRSKEKKWKVRTPGGAVIRIERRIKVPPELISLEFNRDLSVAVEPWGAHVAGTERTKESTVVLHVVADAMTVHTLTLERDTKHSR